MFVCCPNKFQFLFSKYTTSPTKFQIELEKVINNMGVHGDILKTVLTKKEISAEGLAEAIGVSKSTIYNYLDYEKIPKNNREKIENYLEINFSKESANNFQHYKPKKGIKLYNSYVEAGFPAVYLDETDAAEPTVRYELPGFQDCDLMVPVAGDSMYPDFTAGDIIICKKVETELFIQWGHAHLVDTIQGPVLKILMPDDNETRIKLVSSNPKFPPYTLPKEEIKNVWIIKGKLKKHLL